MDFFATLCLGSFSMHIAVAHAKPLFKDYRHCVHRTDINPFPPSLATAVFAQNMNKVKTNGFLGLGQPRRSYQGKTQVIESQVKVRVLVHSHVTVSWQLFN